MAIGNLAFPAEEVCPRGRLASSQMTLQDMSGVGLCSEGCGTTHTVILVTDATAGKSASRRCVWRQDQPLGYTQEHRQINTAPDQDSRCAGPNGWLERCRKPSQPGQATGEPGTEGGWKRGSRQGSTSRAGTAAQVGEPLTGLGGRPAGYSWAGRPHSAKATLHGYIV